MSRRIYDNWERLVEAVVRREQDWQLCHAPSISSSTRSSFSLSSHFSDFDHTDFSASSSSSQHSEVEPQVNVESSPPVSIFRAPEQVYHVNNQPINSRELEILLRCSNPPKNLKPGSYYWYDKRGGFWGKQGYKPSQIISDNLSVGGTMDTKASNGNTSVYINDREITKVELRMLQLLNVKCRRGTNFWVYEDGSYQIEGVAAIKGNIWSKAGTKLICSLLSLPFPHKKSSHASEDYTQPHASEDYAQQEQIKKILLIGYGTTNFLEKAKYFFSPYYEDTEDIPSTLSGKNFSFTLPYDDDDNKLQGYQLIAAPQEDVEDFHESLDMIEDVRIVMFSLSLTDYDHHVVDEHGTYANKMILNKKLFENVVSHPDFDKMPFLLLLTEYDLFEQKIEQSPLNQCDWFCEFNPVPNGEKQGNSAFHYISMQFKRLFAAATGRKLYVTRMGYLDEGYSMHSALEYVQEVLRWDEEKSTYPLSNYYSSSDESSYSEEDV